MFLNHGDLTALVVNDVREESRRSPRSANVLRNELRHALHLHLHREVRVRGAPSAGPPGRSDSPPVPAGPRVGSDSPALVPAEQPVRKGQPCHRAGAAKFSASPKSDSRSGNGPFAVLAYAAN
jgi:hypothetical protein